jgi:hypothetical protein
MAEQFCDTLILIPFSMFKRDPLADAYTPAGISRRTTRLFRGRSKAAVPATPPIMEVQSITTPMDALPIYEEEVYETNIAGIGSGMGPSTAQQQILRIPPDSPPPYRCTDVTSRRGTDEELYFPEV